MPKTIVVIDDEREVRNGMQAWLEELGYQVLTAADGEAGLEQVKDVLPHVVLLDISMPRKDGFQTLAAIKNNPKTAHIPVIMLTARLEAKAILDALHLNATDYVTKPFEEKELLALIKKYEGDYYSYRKAFL